MSLENCSNEHNIDFIAKSFFIFMVSISFINDLYSIKETIFNNEYIQKNINKLSDISDVFKKFLSNKEKKIKDGFIIKNNELTIQKQKDFSKNISIITKKTTNNIITNTDDISNEVFSKKDISEEIKPLEIKSNNIKKKKKIYNNDLMEEVKNKDETSKEGIGKKKETKQLNNKKKADINKEIIED